jgi:hypothetical protein
MPSDAVLVSRAILDQIAEALAAIVQVTGQGFSVLIERLDRHDGFRISRMQPTREDDFALSPLAVESSHGPGCEISDEDAGAYVEWTTMRGSQKRGANLLAGHEDDEEDDAPEEDDPSGQCDKESINTQHDLMRYAPGSSGPGCPIAVTDIGDMGGFHD